MRLLTAFLACISTLLLLACANVYAQTIPRSVEADTLSRQAQPVPLPSLPPAVSSAPNMTVEAPKGAETIHFVLKKIIIEGNTVYTQAQLENYFKPFIGKNVSAADIYAIAARITQRYRADGYDFSMAILPPQKVADGIVHIRVIEGYVEHIRWQGDLPDSDVMLDMADKLLDRHPLNGNTLESIILQLNDLPGLHVQATMTPGDTEGAVDVLLKVERKRVSATLGLNDSASRYLGVWQDSLQADLSGLASPVDKLSLNLVSSVEPMYSRYESGQYSIPINAGGTQLFIGASKSHNAPGFTLTPLEIRSDADYAWFGLSQPLLLSRLESLTVSSQFNVHNIKTDLLATPFYEDRIRTLQFSGTYNLADRWNGSNLVDLDLFKGLHILNATPDGAVMLSRAGGHSDFLKMVINASRLQVINDRFSLLAAAVGQMANVPLLTSEQFGYGGMQFGRAYDPAAISGDDGMAASLELRYDTAYSEHIALQPYAFYDIGKVWDLTTPANAQSGASAGLGIRFQLDNRADIDISLAKPLTLPALPAKLGAHQNDPRLNISLQLTH